MLDFNFIYASEFVKFYKYEWYVTGVESNWDYNMNLSGISTAYSLPTFNSLVVLACIPLIVISLLTLYSLFPTSNVDQLMLEKNREGSDRTSGVNLLCSSGFCSIQGVLCGSFVYDNNDPSGQSIQGLFF